ncbi:ATP-grasp domain-containing protein [Lentzea aerocolonigenes]|uniref:ATP-grasp domain-containing protein n=1 Tax=Lentzea aerocolonigenes TaxID=68170 RepID=UPI0018C8944E|nr:ATP-grasp domain-containing protein [Lentzea aerocolonigenes]
MVKPTGSAGTDGVRICATAGEVREAAAAVLGAENIFGAPNTTVLVEGFLAGQEYMVNTVSADGWHRVLEVWRTVKRRQEGANVYDYFELTDPLDDGGARVVTAARAVLDALGFRWGPAHLELIDAPGGAELVEVSPRFHGGIDLSATTAALGTNQVVDTVRALIGPDRYRAAHPPVAPVRAACSSVILLCPRTGVLTREPDWDALRHLKTFHSGKSRIALGQRVRRTFDMFTSAGNVYLVGEPEEVLADREVARRWAEEELAAAIS